MPTPTSPTMIGRGNELAELSSLLTDTGADGEHRIVLLSGDAGVGKTRLLRALRDHALGEGWQVLAGHCLDFGDSGLPYLPFSEVLGRIDADRPDLVAEVAGRHPALGRLRPGRRTRTSAEADRAELTEATDRGDTFVAVHALLGAAAAHEPLLLVVEDLHWADRSTRDLLGFLFTRSFDHPVAIVASYRSDDLHRRHPLRQQVAEWSRLPQVGRLTLDPLPEHDARALVHELADLDETTVGRIVARAEGNAFFVEELVASDCAGEVPGELADVLLVRLDRLSEEARQVVRAASATGRRVRHELLAATTGLAADGFDAGVRQAVEMNVLESGTHHYSFRHALLGEAVYDDLLPGERTRLHSAYVAALTDGSQLGTAAELALHARRANDLDRAVTASIEAGDEAMAVGGPDEAAHHYQQALELLEDDARVVRLDLDHSKLVVKAANALISGGDTQRAAQLLALQTGRLPADAPAEARARLLSEWADLLTIIETDLDPVAMSTEAVALAPEGESPLRARILTAHARVLSVYARGDDAEAIATEALALAERIGRPTLISEAATTLSGLRVRRDGGGEQQDLRAALETAVEKAAAAGAFHTEMRGRFLLGRSHQDAGEWQLATSWFDSAVVAGDAAGLPWAPYISESRSQLAHIRYLRGEWDELLDLTAVVDDPAGPVIPRGLASSSRLAVLAARGDEVLDRARGLRALWSDEGGVAVHSVGVEIDIATARGDAAAAVTAYDDVVAVLSRLWQEQGRFGARVRLAAQTLAAIAAALPRSSGAERRVLAERADTLLADGEAVRTWFHEQGATWGPEGRMWSSRLRAEHLRVQWLTGTATHDPDDLVAAWCEAIDASQKFGHVPEEARSRAALAQLLRALGDTSRARTEADAARAIAADLRAPHLLGSTLADAARPSRTSSGPRSALTAREREILTLVAEGRSNGQIGTQLFISTKTVSVHVSNILAKLDAASRTEAAAIARRDHLL